MRPIFSGTSDGLKLRNFSLLLVVLGIIAALFSNIALSASDPWAQLSVMVKGLLQPQIVDYQSFFFDLLYTLCFAIIGVSLSVIIGLYLSLLYNNPLIRYICAAFRAVHELFWALIFIQLFGLSASSAILAITIPFACTFARVFHDIYQQAPIKLQSTNTYTKAKISYFFYVQLPQVWPQMASYVRYRFECGVRSSAVLGFVGLPTLGFYLETAFKQGDYSYAGALLLGFYLLIGSIKYWMKLYLLPIYLLLACYFVPTTDFVNSSENIIRFFVQDIWPSVVREANISIIDQFTNYLLWFYELIEKQAVEGLIHTLLLTIMAVACTAVFCVFSMPLLVSMQNNWAVNQLGSTFLLLMRSTPEYILAFVLLLVFGPSMLPAVIALAMHNSGLISYLLERYIRQMKRLKPSVTDMNTTANLSAFMYKQMPSLYMHFISLLMYRAEIILRESAILGMLGVTTLGFYIDSAFEDLRFDRAFALLLITAALNIMVDQLSRKMQLIFTDTGIRVRSKD